MAEYIVRPSGTRAQFEPIIVEAGDHENAAYQAARKLLRTRGNLAAQRVTGIYGKSGVFQAYRILRNGDMSAVGDNMHIAATGN